MVDCEVMASLPPLRASVPVMARRSLVVVGEICGIQSNTLPVAGSSPYGPRSTLYEQSVPITARAPPAIVKEKKRLFRSFGRQTRSQDLQRRALCGTVLLCKCVGAEHGLAGWRFTHSCGQASRPYSHGPF